MQRPGGPKGKTVQPEKRKIFLRIYLTALFTLLMFGAVAFATETFRKIYFPFAWDDDEGAVWWESAHVTHLRALYHPIQQYPYFVVPYPPVFHALTWLVQRITGDYLVAGRLICVFSAIGISLLLGAIVWDASMPGTPGGVRAGGSALASLLCFRLDALNAYIPEMGVDLLALFFTFAGVFLFLRHNQKSRAPYPAFACFVVAILAKQTMLAAPLACLLAATLVSRAKALRYFLFFICSSGAAVGLLAWATHGEILRHVLLYNAVQPFSLGHWIRGFSANLLATAPVAAVSCLALLPVLRHLRFEGRRSLAAWIHPRAKTSALRQALTVLGIELAIALLISLTYGKSGSGLHYFLE